MRESINLIPQEERVQQTKTKVVKASTIFAIILLIIIGGIGGYFYYRVFTTKQQIKDLDTQIADQRAKVTQMKDIEIVARNLYKKSSTLQQIFDTRIYYSKLVTNVNDSTPPSVVVDSFGLGKENTISLSGKADDFRAVQDFMDRLNSKELFESVAINSAGLENRSSKTSFMLVVTYKGDLLRE